jgi:hypothetical protein
MFLYTLSSGEFALAETMFPETEGQFGYVNQAVSISGTSMIIGGRNAEYIDSPGSGYYGGGVFAYSLDVAEETYNPYFGLSYKVFRIDVVRTPSGRQLRNEFDELGDLLSLSRLKGEKNWSYRRRIFDAYANMANSSYRGMVNGITRELSLETYPAIIVNPKTTSPEFLAADPYIKIEGAYVYLYSDYTNGVLDHKIDRYEQGGNYEHLGRLVDFINQTVYWDAHLAPGVNQYTRSMVLFNQSNRVINDGERTQSSTKFKLKKDHIIPGTLWFDNRDFFRTEVDTEAEVGSVGTYYVNYTNGIIVCAQVAPWTIARYQYTAYPFNIMASPVILYDINLDSFKAKMFEQVLQDNGIYEHGLPTKLGADIINELLSVHPMYFGV